MRWDDTKGGGTFHSVGDALVTVSRRLGLAPPTQLRAVFAQWEQAVGASIAAHCRPIGLREGVLTVEVDEPGWATEIRFLHDDLVRAVNDHVNGAGSAGGSDGGADAGAGGADGGAGSASGEALVSAVEVRVAGGRFPRQTRLGRP